MIGFLLKTYPKVSETFILGEILGLERHGVPLHIFSLGKPTDTVFHALNDEVKAPVSYVASLRLADAWHLARAHFGLLMSQPHRYARALRFALRRREGSRAREFILAGGLALQLHEAGVTHVHAHFASHPAAVAELVKELTGIPYSVSAHAKDIYLSHPECLRRKLAGARFTVTCTEYNRRHLASIAAPGTRVHRVYHGLDVNRFCTAPELTPAQPPLILSVGRLREKKGFPILIDACRQLHDAGVQFRCEIVGYGPDRDSLQRQIDRLGLSGTVELAGKMVHHVLVERYRRATMFVLPCLIAGDGDRDGIPNVLLEAMAMRLSVISTPVSGIPEVIQHGHNGELVPPGDAGALAGAVKGLLEQPSRCAALGDAGRRTVRDVFSSEANLEPLRELLTEALAATATAPVTETSAAHLYAP